MKSNIPFVKPTIVRDDLEAVLHTMINDKVGPGDIAQQYAQQLAARYQCSGAMIFRDMHTAISTLYTLCDARSKRTLLLSPLTDGYWIDAARNSVISICYAPLVEHTVSADYGAAPDHTHDCVVIDTTLGYIPDYRPIINRGKMIIEIIGAGLGGRFEKRDVGTFGDIVIIELEEEHIITCGCGVALLCRRQEDYNALARSAHGAEKRNMIPDINAALGMAQLQRLSQFVKQRKAIEKQYAQAIENKPLRYRAPFSTQYVPHSFVVKYPRNRKTLHKFARSNGVEIKTAFDSSAITRYRDADNLGTTQMAYIDEVVRQTVLFPLYPQLSTADAQQVQRVIANMP